MRHIRSILDIQDYGICSLLVLRVNLYTYIVQACTYVSKRHKRLSNFNILYMYMFE